MSLTVYTLCHYKYVNVCYGVSILSQGPLGNPRSGSLYCVHVSIHGLRSCTVNDLSIVVLTNRIVFKNWTQVVVVVRTQASDGGVDS